MGGCCSSQAPETQESLTRHLEYTRRPIPSIGNTTENGDDEFRSNRFSAGTGLTGVTREGEGGEFFK